ncbi:MAG: HIT family protein [Dysgonamonadaceae bacterium]|jgi:histidine triad (HIT) family protein|nr:HIT family protein [Dysgonamonadaceae bacterium]
MSIFSKIIAGEIPSYKVAENERFYAFLDINPIARGHVLVVPKKEVDYIFDLDDDTLSDMVLFSKKLAKAMKKVINCKKIGLMVIGLEVPHAHIHLIPVSKESDISPGSPKKQFTTDEFNEIANVIAEAFISE